MQVEKYIPKFLFDSLERLFSIIGIVRVLLYLNKQKLLYKKSFTSIKAVMPLCSGAEFPLAVMP